MKVRELIGGLTPGQLWGVLGGVLGALGTAVLLGWTVHTWVASAAEERHQAALAAKDVEIAGLTERLATAEDDLKRAKAEVRALGEKERWLALFVQYLLALRGAGGDLEAVAGSAEAKAFQGFTVELVQRRGRGGVAASFGKGGPRENLTLRFSHDGSVWPIPPEFMVGVELGEGDSTRQMAPGVPPMKD